MAFKVIYRKHFQNQLAKLLDYLEVNWSKKVADDFVTELIERISILSLQPNIGIRSQKLKDARSILITKHNRLTYCVKNNTLIILNLSDTRRHPKKNKY
jgi:plasmid stabilization system protein ParE